MRSLLFLGYVCAFVVAIVAAVYGLNAGIRLYLVASGHARPGEAIYLDELAVPVRESGVAVLVSVVTVVAATLACGALRRRLNAGRSS